MTPAEMERAAETATAWDLTASNARAFGLDRRASVLEFAARLKRSARYVDGDRLSENLDAWAERLAAAPRARA